LNLEEKGEGNATRFNETMRQEASLRSRHPLETLKEEDGVYTLRKGDLKGVAKEDLL